MSPFCYLTAGFVKYNIPKVVDQTTGGWDDFSLMSLGSGTTAATCGSSRSRINLLSPFSHRSAIQTRSVFYAGAVEPRCNRRGNRTKLLCLCAPPRECNLFPSARSPATCPTY